MKRIFIKENKTGVRKFFYALPGNACCSIDHIDPNVNLRYYDVSKLNIDSSNVLYLEDINSAISELTGSEAIMIADFLLKCVGVKVKLMCEMCGEVQNYYPHKFSVNDDTFVCCNKCMPYELTPTSFPYSDFVILDKYIDDGNFFTQPIVCSLKEKFFQLEKYDLGLIDIRFDYKNNFYHVTDDTYTIDAVCPLCMRYKNAHTGNFFDPIEKMYPETSMDKLGCNKRCMFSLFNNLLSKNAFGCISFLKSALYLAYGIHELPITFSMNNISWKRKHKIYVNIVLGHIQYLMNPYVML
jgi:hypothetical protein